MFVVLFLSETVFSLPKTRDYIVDTNSYRNWFREKSCGHEIDDTGSLNPKSLVLFNPILQAKKAFKVLSIFQLLFSGHKMKWIQVQSSKYVDCKGDTCALVSQLNKL